MTEKTFILLIFIYVGINLALFILYKFTSGIKILHRIISVLNSLAFCCLLGYGFYRANPLFVVFVPVVLLIAYPLSWGLNKELSEDDLASLVALRSPFPIRNEDRKKIKLGFARLGTFPFFYLLDSWKK